MHPTRFVGRAALPLSVLVLAAAATAAGAAAPALPKGVPVFEEAGGVVVIEVESCRPQGDWKPEKDLKGFTGKGYYTWRGGNLFRTRGKGTLLYPVRVAEDGKYHLAIHNRHDFHDSTEQNDCWTRIDEEKWLKTFSSKRGQWTWHTRHEHSHSKKIPAFYELKAGLHVLQISGRSKGFSIDRIHLYRDGAKNPLDTKRPETKRGGPEADETDDAKPTEKPNGRRRLPFPVR